MFMRFSVTTQRIFHCLDVKTLHPNFISTYKILMHNQHANGLVVLNTSLQTASKTLGWFSRKSAAGFELAFMANLSSGTVSKKIGILKTPYCFD